MRRLILCGILWGIIVVPYAHAQSPEEIAARSAEQSGRLGEALTQYTSALQKLASGSADDQRLREAIIRVAQRMSPRPLIPDEARNRMIRGRAAFKLAKSPADMKDAINEFRLAVNSAPWLGEAYFNLALVYEKAENYPEAIWSYRFYLATQPTEKDAVLVRDKLVELQYLQERSQQRTAAKVKEEQSSSRVAGRWCLHAQAEAGYIHQTCDWEVKVNGDNVEILGPFEDLNANVVRPYRTVYRGSVTGNEIRGSFLFSANCSNNVDMSGTIRQDAQEIRITYAKPVQMRFPCQVMNTSTSWITLMRPN